jgi:hypothetical protein
MEVEFAVVAIIISAIILGTNIFSSLCFFWEDYFFFDFGGLVPTSSFFSK